MRGTPPVHLPPPRSGPGRNSFAQAVVEGLSAARKMLPSRFFYDARGSELFEHITQLPEYYPSRTETAILAANAAEIVQGLEPEGALIELGSGSSTKTEHLLAAVAEGMAYVPVDVSSTALSAATKRLRQRFPRIAVTPLLADFAHDFALPTGIAPGPRLGFFPGSTIGNFTPPEAIALLARLRRILGPGGRLVVGVDLKKDLQTLLPAYDDAEGVTAEFNLNILVRINRELAGSIDPACFRHRAIYNAREGRIEMHLVSLARQDAMICNRHVRFEAGETIHTENSYKYTIGEFWRLAAAAGWSWRRVWTDPAQLFSVHELT